MDSRRSRFSFGRGSLTSPDCYDDGIEALKFIRFTNLSAIRLKQREQLLKEQQIQRAKHAQEAHLVDGELKFGIDEGEFYLPPVNEDLADGNQLTKSYGICPEYLIGAPLEELDQGITDKTFVVISKRFSKRVINRFSATKSLFILNPWNPIRRFMLRIVTNQLFDMAIFLTIVTNCVFLAMNDSDLSDTSELYFLAIYTMECICKVLARGFCLNKFTYLRDPWNWLDFIVIITAFMMLPGVNLFTGNLQGLRTFRVLRALKTVSIVPGLKTIVNALLRAFVMLFEVIILTIFCLMVFAMFGIQFYKGALRQKCVKEVYGYVDNPSESYDMFYAKWVRDEANWFDVEDDYVICGNGTGAGACPKDYLCMPNIGENPQNGFLNFDNFAWALVACFQLITLDFWEDVYNKIIRARGPWHVLYFVVVIFFGSFYLINLMLAVVSMSYEEEAVSAGKEREREKKENAKSKHKPMHDFLKIHLAAKRIVADIKDVPQSEMPGTVNEDINNSAVKIRYQYQKSLPSVHASMLRDSQFANVKSSDSSLSSHTVIIRADALLDPDVGRLEGHVIDRNCVKCAQICCCKYTAFLKLQNIIYVFVSDPLFDLFITTCICINTVFLALEHHEQGPGMDEVLKISNIIFTTVFCLEAFFKILGLGKYYFKSEWNLFDLFIVIGSVFDTGLESLSGFSALRAVRLLRVFKLAQSWPTMRLLLTIIVNTLGALANLCIILGIVIYIFAIIGLQLFSTDYKLHFKPEERPRWNFIDFYHSMLMIFRVLCGEWIEALYECMEVSREICMVVFLPALMFGNFIVLNLFLALLLNAFASDSLEKQKDSSVERSKLMQGIDRLRYYCCCLCTKGLSHGKVAPLPTSPWESASEEVSLDELNEGGGKPTDISNQSSTASDILNLVDSSIPECLKSPFTQGEKLLPLFAEVISINQKTRKLDNTEYSSLDIVRGGGNVGGTSPNETMNHPDSRYDSNVDGNDSDKRFHAEIFGEGTSRAMERTNDPFDTYYKRQQFVNFKAIVENRNNSAKKSVQVSESEQSRDTGATSTKGSTAQSEPEDCFPHWLWIPGKEECGGSMFCRAFYQIRIIMKQIVDHRTFEMLILFIILLSSLTLAFEDVYLDQKPALNSILEICNVVFAVIFIVEMLIKWIGLGFTIYFTNAWCILDFFIVCVSSISLVSPGAATSKAMAYRSLRTLRALRPLRAISRWQGMKIVVNALINAIPAIMNVFLVCMVFWLIFSIMGVQLFAGKFYKCINVTTQERVDAVIIPNRQACEKVPGLLWWNSKINFDNFVNGFLALFQVATFEGWMEVISDAVDSDLVDVQPKRENHTSFYLYFVIFIIFGSFFSLNLFIGVIIDNFNVLKKKYEGSYLDSFLTQSQRNYYTTLRKVTKKKPQRTIKRPKNRFQLMLYAMAMSNKFELAIDITIFGNMMALAIVHYGAPVAILEIEDMINIIFTVTFILEATIKIIGLRIHYFRFLWNVFDFVVVILSIIACVESNLNFFSNSPVIQFLLSDFISAPSLLRITRLFRIGRVLRIIKSAKGIRKLLFALIISLPAIFNIGALLFLIMYMYAIIGMSSFGLVKVNGVMDEVVNFQTFGNSFMLLLRLATSAGWNDILDALLISPPFCDPYHYINAINETIESSNGDCGIPYLAIPYMVSYIVIVWLIVINMYIAVILENFNQAHEQEEVGITEDDFDMFYVIWEKYDPHATQFIKYEYLADFVNELDQPLQIPKPNEIALVSFNLPIMDGEKMHCLDILIALVRNVLADVEETEELKTLKEQMEEKFAQNFPARVNITVKSSTLQRKKEDVAARTLQRAWRSFKAQKAMRNITALAVQQKMRRSSAIALRRKNEVMIALQTKLSNALNRYFASVAVHVADSGSSLETDVPPAIMRGLGKEKIQVIRWNPQGT